MNHVRVAPAPTRTTDHVVPSNATESSAVRSCALRVAHRTAYFTSYVTIVSASRSTAHPPSAARAFHSDPPSLSGPS
eukprot:scaffold154513_cov28-Tisochrysis_lutea.AAC.4